MKMTHYLRLGMITISGNATLDLGQIQLPRRAAICALNDVLAVNIENTRRP